MREYLFDYRICVAERLQAGDLIGSKIFREEPVSLRRMRFWGPKRNPMSSRQELSGVEGSQRGAAEDQELFQSSAQCSIRV